LTSLRKTPKRFEIDQNQQRNGSTDGSDVYQKQQKVKKKSEKIDQNQQKIDDIN
jgi:hypothetical protein